MEDSSRFMASEKGEKLEEGGDFWELYRRLGECYEADLRKGTRSYRHSHASSSELRREEKNETSSFDKWNGLNAALMPLPPSGSPKMLSPLSDAESSLEQKGVMAPPKSMSGRQGLLPPGGFHPAIANPSANPPGKTSVRTNRSNFSSEVSHIAAEPRSCWAQKSKQLVGRRASVSMAQVTTSTSFRLQRNTRTCVLSPNGHLRNLWDFVGILILGVDCVVVPLLFVQPLLYDIFPSLNFHSKVSVVYWILDMVLSFFTGYLEKGNLVMDRRKIALRYVRTWFVPDLMVSAIDVAMIVKVLVILVQEDDSLAASTRLLRLMRLSRIVRLGKLKKFAAFLRDKFESEVAYTQFSLVLLILGMCLLEHIIACGWFGIGSLSATDTWLSRSELHDASFTLQYTTALRWSFSQLGVGGTELEAVNEREGIYSNVVALVSLITFSSVVSSMTSLVSTLQGQGREETQQFSLLRRFLRVHHIEENLSHRITRFLHYTYHERTGNVEDPAILQLLSKSLQMELQLARHREHLVKLPFLAQLLSNPLISFQEGHVMQVLAQSALTSHDLGEDDVVFCHGNEATSSYLLLQGALTYLQMDVKTQPCKDRWICEMCLWTPWSHLGDLRCEGFSKIYALHVQEFCDVISSSAAVQVQAHCYAKEYVVAMAIEHASCDLWESPMEKANRSSHLRGTEENMLHGMMKWTWNITSPVRRFSSRTSRSSKQMQVMPDPNSDTSPKVNDDIGHA